MTVDDAIRAFEQAARHAGWADASGSVSKAASAAKLAEARTKLEDAIQRDVESLRAELKSWRESRRLG